MDQHNVLLILAAFFLDGLAEDPGGVGDWLNASGVDPDEFVPAVHAISEI
jgi:hypothetical protein